MCALGEAKTKPFTVLSLRIPKVIQTCALFRFSAFQAFNMDTRAQAITINVITVAVPLLLCFLTFLALFYSHLTYIIGADEAVYATKARAWLYGTPADQWGIYRPIGMSILGWIVLHFSDSERSLRLVGVLFGMLTPGVVFFLFRRMSNLWIALGAAAVTATSSLFIVQAPLFLDDIPSSTMLFAALAVIYIYFQSSGKSNSIYLLPIFIASSFYLRYGTIPAFIAIAVFSYLILLPRFLSMERPNFRKAGHAVLIITLLFLPHFIYSLIATHDLFGVLNSATDVAHRTYIGQGVVQYINWLPQQIGGWTLGITAILGTATTFAMLTAQRTREQYTGLIWVGCIGILTFFLTGFFVHAEQRYVFFPMVLLSGVGVAGIYYILADWSLPLAVASPIVIGLIGLYFGVSDYQNSNAYLLQKSGAISNAVLVEALGQMQADSADANGCDIWTAINGPRVSWYSKCYVEKVKDERTFISDFSAHPGAAHYSLVSTGLNDPQITPRNAALFGVSLTEIYRYKDFSVGDLVVYRIELATSSPATTTQQTL